MIKNKEEYNLEEMKKQYMKTVHVTNGTYAYALQNDNSDLWNESCHCQSLLLLS